MINKTINKQLHEQMQTEVNKEYIHVYIDAIVYPLWMVFFDPENSIAQVGLIFVDLCDPPHCCGVAQGSRTMGIPRATWLGYFQTPEVSWDCQFFFLGDLGFWRHKMKFG